MAKGRSSTPRTCQGCHTRDGRGATPPDQDTPMDSMSIRLGLGVNDQGETIPDPNYGTMLQTFGLASFHGDGGIAAGLSSFGGGADAAIGEGFALVEYEPVSGAYDDGAPFELRRPTYKVRELSYGDFSSGIRFSPRLAPQLIGLGLLDAVPAAQVRALADPDDANDDGISGRVSEVYDQTVEERRLGSLRSQGGHRFAIAADSRRLSERYGRNQPLRAAGSMRRWSAHMHCRRS